MVDTPLGAMRAAAEDQTECSSADDSLPADGSRPAAICGLWFIGQKYFPHNTETWVETPLLPVFIQLGIWLEEYFNSKIPEKNVPLAPAGTIFQQAVWKLLQEIPFGETITYGGIADKLRSGGAKASAQAVGGAVGHNPISILIPCHRVVGADSSLTGYAGGIDKKRALLELEKRIMTKAALDKRPGQ